MQVLLDITKQADLDLIKSLAKRLGLKLEEVTEEKEDAALLKAMVAGKSSRRASRSEVMKALGQNES